MFNLFLLILAFFLLSCAPELEEGGPFFLISYEPGPGPVPPVNIVKDSIYDSRDGKSYKTVKIGDHIWMAENLNFNADSSVCYENQDSYCAIYGRLYNWEAAMSACPDGWHLPGNAEWDALIEFTGGSSVAGRYLKATTGWDADWNKKGNGMDIYGFAALPGGDFNARFYGAGIYGYWWSSNTTQISVDYIVNSHYSMLYSDDAVINYNNIENRLFSARCVKNWATQDE